MHNFLRLWLGYLVNTADADAYNKCNGASVDTTPMDVDYGTPADQAACPMTAVENYPGTPAFVTTEYSNFLDYVDEVTSCLAMTSPTAGPVTTTLPAPAHVQWDFYYSDSPDCSAEAKASLKMVSGSDLSECNKWVGHDHGHQVEVYIKVSCNGGGIQKEIWFQDPQCAIVSKQPSLGQFSVDAANYAKDMVTEKTDARPQHPMLLA